MRRQFVNRYISSDYSSKYSEAKTAAEILNKGKLLVQWCAGDLQQLKNHDQFRKSVKSVFESYSQKCLLIR